jgi:hypothetical protein
VYAIILKSDSVKLWYDPAADLEFNIIVLQNQLLNLQFTKPYRSLYVNQIFHSETEVSRLLSVGHSEFEAVGPIDELCRRLKQKPTYLDE